MNFAERPNSGWEPAVAIGHRPAPSESRSGSGHPQSAEFRDYYHELASRLGIGRRSQQSPVNPVQHHFHGKNLRGDGAPRLIENLDQLVETDHVGCIRNEGIC